MSDLTLQRLVRHSKASPLSERFDRNLLSRWTNFTEFLVVYDRVASLVKTAADLEEVAYWYLAESAKNGTIYVEFMLSPPDLLRDGIPYSEQLLALTSAVQRANDEWGIECRLIVTCVRHLGPEAAIAAAKLVTERPHPLVVGFGLTGNELLYEVGDFAPAFKIAAAAGLKLTAHAGEHRPAATIREAVEQLGLLRVGHGIRAVEDRSVLKFLSENRIGLEVCLSSNIALELFKTLDQHPLPQLIAAAIPVALGTDDPAFFMTSPQREYQLAKQILSHDSKTDVKISLAAIDMALYLTRRSHARFEESLSRCSARVSMPIGALTH